MLDATFVKARGVRERTASGSSSGKYMAWVLGSKVRTRTEGTMDHRRCLPHKPEDKYKTPRYSPKSRRGRQVKSRIAVEGRTRK